MADGQLPSAQDSNLFQTLLTLLERTDPGEAKRLSKEMDNINGGDDS